MAEQQQQQRPGCLEEVATKDLLQTLLEEQRCHQQEMRSMLTDLYRDVSDAVSRGSFSPGLRPRPQSYIFRSKSSLSNHSAAQLEVEPELSAEASTHTPGAVTLAAASKAAAPCASTSTGNNIDSSEPVAYMRVAEVLGHLEDSLKMMNADPAETAKRFKRFVHSRRLEACISVLIFSSSIFVGIQLDWSVKHVGSPTPEVFGIAEWTFNIAFAVELSLRILAERRSFLASSNRNRVWNVFDVIIVTSSLLFELFRDIVSNISALRILRMVKLLRGFRVVRVLRFFRHLRVMLGGIMSSAKPLVWALFLLFLTTYVFGACIMPFVLDELKAQNYDSRTNQCDDEDVCTLLVKYYGSILRTSYTLYLAVTGGISWGEPASTLVEIHPLLGFLFCVYVAFAVMCVMNIITGVFVENANRQTARDDEAMIAEEMVERLRWFKDMRILFDQADASKDGIISFPEFQKWVSNVHVQYHFKKLGLEVHTKNARTVFNLLDIDHRGVLDFDKFALGVEQIRGPVLSLDIARVRLDCKNLEKKLMKLSRAFCESQFVQDPIMLGQLEQLEREDEQILEAEKPTLRHKESLQL